MATGSVRVRVRYLPRWRWTVGRVAMRLRLTKLGFRLLAPVRVEMSLSGRVWARFTTVGEVIARMATSGEAGE